jgi:hypothetical protein
MESQFLESPMKKFLTLCVVVAMLSMLGAPLFAHHGRGQTYAMEEELTLRGQVTEVVWRNPHVLYYVDVEGADGKVVNWAFENGGVSQLAREGYHRNSLKAGQVITAIVHPARNGSPTSIVVRVILPDGTEMMCRECD